ncbi:hypothetical protein GCM10022226_46790 [Sphaerisporangium flaviroseum]|uniref:Restriction endonuclease type IV Mrr domain-containing protein n=1 Tax=Sphaerisporangium flaviroseum TaxID=509199 RepID=A0ABP7ILF4_9ACTN
MPWDSDLDGDLVERFVAALLLLENPHGNRITPAGGDRGVDIQIEHPDGGFDVYQVKRYTGPLTAAQKNAVKESWEIFLAETLPVRHVRSWTLVAPLNPSNQRLDWFRELTGGQAFPTYWMGRASLDGKAGDNPRLVEYFFGNGAVRLQELMTQAMYAGSRIEPGLGSQGLLDGVVSRHASLAAALNDVDPFYTYRIEIRSGRLRDLPWNDADSRSCPSAALIEYKELDEDTYVVLWTIPRAGESAYLRPITTSVILKPGEGSPELQAVREFLEYGAPLRDVPATVTAIEGPPSLVRDTGDGRIHIMIPPRAAEELPDLEIRLIAPDETPLGHLDVVDIRYAQGSAGQGRWLAARDRSGVLECEFLMGGPGSGQLRMTMQPLTGKTPAQVLPAVRLVSAFNSGAGIMLAVREGQPFSHVWGLGEVDEATTPWGSPTVKVLEALRTVQQHTTQRVVIPAHIDTEELKKLLLFSRLLNGEQVPMSWDRLPLPARMQEILPETDQEMRLRAALVMSLQLGGREITLDCAMHVFYQGAILGESADDTITLVPGPHGAATALIGPLVLPPAAAEG